MQSSWWFLNEHFKISKLYALSRASTCSCIPLNIDFSPAYIQGIKRELHKCVQVLLRRRLVSSVSLFNPPEGFPLPFSSLQACFKFRVKLFCLPKTENYISLRSVYVCIYMYMDVWVLVLLQLLFLLHCYSCRCCFFGLWQTTKLYKRRRLELNAFGYLREV